MLFAVEGGGFFSSSASGYSKGLTLLLLGQKNKEKPMRVIPWNQYQSVDPETTSDPHLASENNHLVRRCACFVCFGGAASGLEISSPLKVEPTQNQEELPEHPDIESNESNDQTHLVDIDESNESNDQTHLVGIDESNESNDQTHLVGIDESNESNDQTHLVDTVNDEDIDTRIISLKSSLKKSANSVPSAAIEGGEENSNEQESLCENEIDITCQTERRKVQWTDKIGGNLFEIREFDMSEDRSDDEFDHGISKTCLCTIM